MEELYKFKIKTDQFAIELESTNKDFVENHIVQLMKESKSVTMKVSPAPVTTPAPAPVIQAPVIQAPAKKAEVVEVKAKTPTPAPVPTPAPAPTSTFNMDAAEADAVVQTILSSDKLRVIKKNVLGKANQLNKILMVFYFTNQQYGNQYLTTSFVERVLSRFGKKIAKSNLGTKIKNNSTFFIADSVPKRGTATKYQVSEKGLQQFEEVLKKKK